MMKHHLKTIDKGMAKPIQTKEFISMTVIEVPLFFTVSNEKAKELTDFVNQNTVWELLNKLKTN